MKKLFKLLVNCSAIIVCMGSISNGMDQNSRSDNNITETVLHTYKQINDNWRYPVDTSTQVETTKSWRKVSVVTTVGHTSAVVWDFETQPSFSQALKEITTAKLIMECSNAARIVRLSLISAVIGDEGMLKLASNLKEQYPTSPFNVMSALSWKFFKKVDTDQESQFYAYPFVNLPAYTEYQNGPDGNHNIIKTPNNSYIGFSPDFFTQERSYEELSMYLYDRFMDESDTKPQMIEKHGQFCQNLNYTIFEEKRREYQNSIGYFAFDSQAAKIF